MVADNIRNAQVKAIGVLFVLAALVLGGALLCAGCTYNSITFETDSVRFSDEFRIEPGQGGDSSDTGSTGAPTTGGEGKMSPGGSNLLDGYGMFALVIQQGGETPTTTDAKAAATVQSPNSSTSTGEGTSAATTDGGTTPGTP